MIPVLILPTKPFYLTARATTSIERTEVVVPGTVAGTVSYPAYEFEGHWMPEVLDVTRDVVAELGLEMYVAPHRADPEQIEWTITDYDELVRGRIMFGTWADVDAATAHR